MNRFCLLPTALCLLFMATVQAAEIVVPKDIKEHSLVEVSTVTTANGYAWFVTGSRGMEIWKSTAPKNQSIVFTGPPGQYTVMLVLSTEGGGLDQAHALLTIGDQPSPDPPVPPVPVPVPGDLAVVILTESTERNWEKNEAIVLVGLRKYANGKKLWLMISDPDQKDADTDRTPKWLEVAQEAAKSKEVNLPAVVVGSIADGVFSAVAVEDLPQTVESAVELIEKYQPDQTSLFVPTPMRVVERMLREAKLTSKDVLYDLGSGDGRIPILAARAYGCRAVGYEIDPTLVAKSQLFAERCGVADLVTFRLEDCRDADLRKASVITMYLDEDLQGELAEQFGRLKPGTRLVSHAHRIPGLPAERTVKEDGHEIHLWEVPFATARLSGPKHAGPHGNCGMCLGNHLIGNHKISRTRLDDVGYKRWQTIHDNAHNAGNLLACAL